MKLVFLKKPKNRKFRYYLFPILLVGFFVLSIISQGTLRAGALTILIILLSAYYQMLFYRRDYLFFVEVVNDVVLIKWLRFWNIQTVKVDKSKVKVIRTPSGLKRTYCLKFFIDDKLIVKQLETKLLSKETMDRVVDCLNGKKEY